MQPVSRTKAAIVSISLSVLFLIIYGSCNWLSAHRAHVGSFYFGWERNLPFVPQLIPAYLSLDLFFIGAPFLCLTMAELHRYARRIALAILIAGACFVFFPLRYDFARPETAGWLGLVFSWFRSVDVPYNLVPSLHAALLLLVGNVYVRRWHGAIRIAAISWFILIGISPVLVYQHHVIDIAAGFILACYCFYLVPAETAGCDQQGNGRIGHYYSAAALTLLLAAVLLRSWWLLLLWPAAALGFVALGYFRLASNVYRKHNCRLPWHTYVVLGPCLLGQKLSKWYYRRRCRSWDPVTPEVWNRCKLDSAYATAAVRAGVIAVLDLTAEFSETKPFREIDYRNIAILDLTPPTTTQLMEMARFIADRTSRGIVYVHCKIGYSRSAAAVAAYLIMTGKAENVEKAFAAIHRVRPSIIIRPEIVSSVQQFAAVFARPRRIQRFVLASATSALA